jgi:agmatine deiminase
MLSRNVCTSSSNLGSNTPRSCGFRMPAEWERHEATWMVWPQNSTDWPGKFAAIPWVYADIVRHLSQVETVHLVVHDQTIEDRAKGVLKKTGVNFSNVRFHQWPTNRGWTRDSGPVFVRNKENSEIAVTNWKFNAWAKYEDWLLDDQLPTYIAHHLELKQWSATAKGKRIVLEGGSIDANGAGVLMTTEECLLSKVQERNPGLDRADLELAFGEYLGIEKVLWLNRGIVGDDTHGHVDDIARFADASTIIAAVEPNKSDPNHQPLQENLVRLREAQNIDGQPFRIFELPMPAPVIFRGQRVPASYANFYIANDLVLVPTFNDPKDRIALQILSDVFPNRQVVGIHSRDLIWGLGALHCMTQQQPALIAK